MESRVSNNKRIVKNTLVLYIRMILKLIVSLYTSRVVLETLGFEDYGIYDVVAGFVSMFVFFNSSITNVIQRYLNIGLAGRNEEITERYFRQGFSVVLLVSLIVFVIGETVGLWFVMTQLVIPESRVDAVFLLYQVSLVTVICNMNQVTFVSAIVANEDMGIYAYLSIFEVVARLCVAICIKYIIFDSLILYGVLLLLVSVIVLLFYITYCRKKYKESVLKLYFNKGLLKEMGSFVGYNIFGCFSWSMAYQGVNVLMNIFFGPLVNAARGISSQVTTAMSGFIDSIMTAFKPQIIKSYAVGDKAYMLSLFEKSSKFSYFMIIVLSVPVIVNANYILELWLGRVPEYAVGFVQLALLDVIVSSLSQPIWIIANATGKIKNNQVYGRLFTLAILPVSYIMLCVTSNIYMPMIVIVIMQVAYWIYTLMDIRKQIGFNLLYYVRTVFLPCLLITVVSWFIYQYIGLIYKVDNLLTLFSQTIIIWMLLSLSIYFVLNREERKSLKVFLIKKLKKE